MTMRRVPSLIVGLAFAVVALISGAPRLRAQAPAATNPTFEVASVKPNRSGPGPIRLGFAPGGRFMATNVTLRMLIGVAYGAPRILPDFQILGGPKWLESERFDIVAKADGDPKPGPNGPPPEMFLMMRALLAERFQLMVHSETKEMAIYMLVMAKSDGQAGSQLHAASVDCAALMAAARARGGQPPPPPQPGERPQCGIRLFPGNMVAGGMPLAQLANTLSSLPAVNRVVVDKTGLTGNFDWDLKWTPDQMPPAAEALPGAPPLPAIDPNGPSLFTAVQEQLGLKLESTKGPVDVLVIDRAEHPTEE